MHKRRRWWVIGGCISSLILVVGIVGVWFNNASSISTNVPASNPSAQVNTEIDIAYSIRTAAQIGASNPSTPVSGKTYLVVSFNIANHGYSSFTISPYYFSVTTNNVKYAVSDVTFNLDNPLKSADVANGFSVDGDLAYEVPVNSTNFKVQYDGLKDYEINWTKH